MQYLDRLFGIRWISDSEFRTVNKFIYFLCKMAVKQNLFTEKNKNIFILKK